MEPLNPNSNVDEQVELDAEDQADLDKLTKMIMFLTENFSPPQYPDVLNKLCALLLSYESIINNKDADQVFTDHSIIVKGMIKKINDNKHLYPFFQQGLPNKMKTKSPPPAGAAVTEPNTSDSSGDEEWYEPDSFSDSDAYEAPFKFSPGE